LPGVDQAYAWNGIRLRPTTDRGHLKSGVKDVGWTLYTFSFYSLSISLSGIRIQNIIVNLEAERQLGLARVGHAMFVAHEWR
jgi:hypothetical protein